MTGRSCRLAVVIIGGGLLLESRVDERLALVPVLLDVRGGGSVCILYVVTTAGLALPLLLLEPEDMISRREEGTTCRWWS